MAMTISRRTMMGTAMAGTLAASATAASKSPARAARIIDVHSHALLPRWLEAVAKAQNIGREAIRIAGTPVPEWTPELHIAAMDANGIEAGILSWPSATSFLKGPAARELARALNEDLAAIIAKYPGRFGAFAVLPLDDMDAANAEMAYALDVLKFDGVASSTHIGGVYLGDTSFDSWFDEMNRRQATLFVHPTTPPDYVSSRLGINPAILEFMFDSTRMVTNMVLSGAKKRFSGIKLISTHGGGTIPYLASRLSILEPQFGAGPGRPTLSDREIVDTLSTFYFDLTASTAAASLDAMLHLVPASRLMLGFDFPMMPATSIAPSQQRFADYSKIGAAERRAIARDNALGILPGLAARLKS